MQTRRSWDEQRSLLTRTYRVIAVDLPGLGESLDVEATMPAATDALQATWRTLGVERTHLAGYSLGGRFALYVATQHPDQVMSLLTIGAHAGLESNERAVRRRVDFELADRAEREGIEWLARYWAAQPLFASLARRGPEFVAGLERMRTGLDVRGAAASLRGMGAGATEPFWDQLERIQCRCTFVAGAEDVRYIAHAARLAGAVPAGHIEVIPGAGHAVHLEQPEAFARVLAAHLSSL